MLVRMYLTVKYVLCCLSTGIHEMPSSADALRIRDEITRGVSASKIVYQSECLKIIRVNV